MAIIMKKHVTQDGQVIMAVCDENLIGQTFEEGNAVLNLKSEFYNGKAAGKEELDAAAEEAHLINAAGKESVEWVLSRGLANNENIITVQGIPNVQILIEK